MRSLLIPIVLGLAGLAIGSSAQTTAKNEAHLKMALVNIKSLYTDGADKKANQVNLQANLQRHFYFIDRVAAEGAEFVGFPELSVNGYHYSDTMSWLNLEGPEVKALQKKAIEKRVYLSVGLAIQDADGKRWNVQIVIDPEGRIIAVHRKIYLTKEKGFTEAGSEHKVFEVKKLKMGIAICADGSDRKNLQALVDNGAQLIYAPHANTTGNTIAGWYKFRDSWSGPNGWIAQLKVYAALHNQAGLYNAEFQPPAAKDVNTGWASGAWVIGPDGKTLAQMPTSTQKNDSKENVLFFSVPLPKPENVGEAKRGPDAQDNSPRFRGPNADGVANDDACLPDTWNKKDNVKWVADVPGWGLSAPVVWGDKVFVTTVVSDGDPATPKKGLYLGQGVRTPAKGVHHWLVYCFDLKSGKTLWKQEAHAGEPKVPRHPKSGYAAETPATDGKRLYVLFGDLGLYCYDLEGKPLWSHKIEPKKTLLDYGAAASPVVHEGQVLLLYDNQEGSYLASFDAETGKQRWRTERAEKTTWATPFIWKNKDRTEIVTCGKTKNRAYDLAGKLLWEFDGRMSNLVIPSPFAAQDMLYIASGYVADAQRPVYAIKPGASGDISLKDGATSNEFIAWYQPKAGPYNPSPIVYNKRYYTLFDGGFLTCHDALTGKEIYGKQRFPMGASFTASPWAYNGKLFFLSEDGTTYVIKAGADFKVLHSNPLDELCLATPAVSQGHLLIRTASKLYCITNDSTRKGGAK